MPIPQLKKSNKNQGWRTNKKRYYVSRKNNLGSIKSRGRNTRSLSSTSRRNGNPALQKAKRTILIFSLLFFIACVFISLIVVAWISRGLPDPNRLIEREIAQSTRIYDRTGETILYEIHGNEQRTLVNLNEIPEYIKWATIAIEDKNFYKHKGISLWGIFRGVVWQKLKGGSVQGGSTLTQQFVKNAILTPERTIKRKIKEWILAYKIEDRYTKDEILQMYLNEIPYGSTAYGIEAASQKYFGKNAKDINIAEAAILAALPQAPSLYSPYGSYKDNLIGRQQYIIDLMVEQKYITEEQAEEAKSYELEFKKQTANITAPHFVMYVKEILSEKYGEKLVEQGGLKIYTTLDLYKQEIAEDVITEQTTKNEEQYNATNASLVSIDPKTGQILAMVGSRDYFDEEIDGQVNIATSKRQPGSSLKPLVYATTFLKGYTPDTILYDVVTNFSNDPQKPYEPHNYDDQERGPVTIRKALAGSLNTTAVKAIYLAGIDNVLNLAQDLGYTTLNDRDRFGLSLVLGGGEVKLLEHVNAYGAFAREGYLQSISAILKVEDKDGKVIEEFKAKEKKVLDPKVARQINNILSDNNARSYVFGEQNWLTLGNRPVAAKTGTTNDYRDAWTVGYTPSIVTGVWVGNNDNSEMKRGAAGGAVAAPIWRNYMQKVLGDTPIEYFKDPEPSKTGIPILDGEASTKTIIKIDKASGLLATENTPESFIEEKVFYQPHCILYYINKDDPLSGPPSNPSDDPQFELWETRVLEWAEKQSSTTPGDLITDIEPPSNYDNLHLKENLPSLEVIQPKSNQTLLDPNLIVSVKVSAPRGINRIEYYVDNNLFFANYSYPFGLEQSVDFLNNGFHNLKVRACDDVDNCTVKELEFNLILDKKDNNDSVSISLIEPSNGLALSNIDFPLNFKASINPPDLIARTDFYYYSETNSQPIFITSIQPITDNPLSGIWKNAPPSGTYKFYGEAIGWNKQKAKSNELTISITNNN